MGRLGGGTRERLGERERAACPAQGETRADDICACTYMPEQGNYSLLSSVSLPLVVVNRDSFTLS